MGEREGGMWEGNKGGREAVGGRVGGSVEKERDGRMDGRRMKRSWVGVRGREEGCGNGGSEVGCDRGRGRELLWRG